MCSARVCRVAAAVATLIALQTLGGSLPPGANPTLVDFQTVDCNHSLIARFRVGSQHYSVTEPAPCSTIDFSGSTASTIQSIINRANAANLWQPLDPNTAGYTLLRQHGDCHDVRTDVRDDLTGKIYNILVALPCSVIDFSVPANVARNVVNYHLDQGALLLSRDTSEFEKRCDYQVNGTNYLQVFAQVPATSSHWRTICFAGGTTYTQAHRFDGYENLILKGAGIGHSWFQTYTPRNPSAGPQASLHFSGGNNIAINDLRVENLYEYTVTNDQNTQVSTALLFSNVDFAHVRDSAIYSYGKITLHFSRGLMASVVDTTIFGAYFVNTTEFNNQIIDNSSLQQSLVGDLHSLIWSDDANWNMRHVDTLTYTGRSLVSGASTPQHNLRIENIDTNGLLDSWIQQHPNYSHLRVHLHPDYPSGLPAFWNNPDGGGGPSVGSFVIEHP